MGEPELPALLVSHHRPGFYMRVVTEGRVQAGDPIVKTGTGPHALTRRRHRRAALPARTRPREAARRAPDPGAQPRLAGVVPRTRRPPRTPAPARQGSRAGVDRVPAAARDQGGPREPPPSSSIYLAAPDGSPLPAARAGQYLTLRIPGLARPAPVRSYSLSSAPGAGAYRISVKHEPHGTVSGYLTGTRARRRGPRRRGAPRRLRPRPRHRPGPAHLRRHRRHPGAVDAARARGAPQRPRGLVDPRRPRTSRAGAGRRGPRPARLPTARPRARVLEQGDRRRTRARPRRARPAHESRAGRTRRPGRPRTPTSAARPRS